MIKRPTRREIPRANPVVPVGVKHYKRWNDKFQEEFVYWGYRLALLGASDHEMGQAFGVYDSTVVTWMNRHPAFRKAVTEGRGLADALVSHALYKRATGFMRKTTKVLRDADGNQMLEAAEEEVPPDVTACIFWLKTRRPDLWGEQPKVTKHIDITAEMMITDPYMAFRALKDAMA